MPRIPFIEIDDGRSQVRFPILYEDRSVIAIDKPAGWLLVPFSWQKTSRNLQAAISSSIAARDFWARSRNLKFLRNVHRLDGATSGVLLFAKSMGAVETYSDLFESRHMEKTYLAVVHGVPVKREWTCQAPIGSDPSQFGRMKVDGKDAKDAETSFRVVNKSGSTAVIEARPRTGRTHQIRVHLLKAGHPVVGDDLYGPDAKTGARKAARQPFLFPMGLRAVQLAYRDPFLRKAVRISAPVKEFLHAFGFDDEPWTESPRGRSRTGC